MLRRDLLDLLTDEAREFRKDRGHFTRNRHMHLVWEAPHQDVVDAVLVGFINAVAARQGVDYGLYAVDLSRETPEKSLTKR